VDDVNTLIETAMAGKAATQVIQGERQFDLVVRMQEQFRSDEEAIKNLLIAHARWPHLPLSQFADVRVESGACVHLPRVEFALHRGPVQRGRADLGQRRRRGPRQGGCGGQAPIGYKFDWGGEYKEYLASRQQMKIILPLTVVLILMILFALYGNLKIPADHILQRPGDVSGGRVAGPAAHPHQFQRVLHAGLSWP